MKELTPLPAATVTLVRDTPRGLEVLLLKRNLGSAFMPGVHVFPGGALDRADRSEALYSLCDGLDDAAASRTLGVERGGLAYWIAAVREAFEEAGILLAGDRRGKLVATAGVKSGDRFRSHRDALNAGRQEFTAMMQGEGLRLAAGRLTYFSHWITPVGAPRRYDTRFFLAVAPERQEASHDGGETIAHAWLRPAAALDAHAKGEIKLRFPTLRTLESFAGFTSVGSLAAGLRGRGSIPPLLPRLTRDGRSLLPGEPGYEEAGREGSWKI